MFFYVLDASGDALEIPLDVNDGTGEVDESLVGEPGEYGVHGIEIGSLRARMLRLPCRTVLLTVEEAEPILAALEQDLPIPFGGDWIEAQGRDPEAFEADVGPIERVPELEIDGPHMFRLVFELQETFTVSSGIS